MMGGWGLLGETGADGQTVSQEGATLLVSELRDFQMIFDVEAIINSRPLTHVYDDDVEET